MGGEALQVSEPTQDWAFPITHCYLRSYNFQSSSLTAFNPFPSSMLPKVDGWLQKYKGNEKELRNKLIQKLDVKPKSSTPPSNKPASIFAPQYMQEIHNNDPPEMEGSFGYRDIQMQKYEPQTAHRRLPVLDSTPTPTPKWRQQPTSNLDDAKLQAQLEIDR